MPYKEFTETKSYRLAKFIHDHPEHGYLSATEWVRLTPPEKEFSHTSAIEWWKRRPHKYSHLVAIKEISPHSRLYASAKFTETEEEPDHVCFSPTEKNRALLSYYDNQHDLDRFLNTAIEEWFKKKLP